MAKILEPRVQRLTRVMLDGRVTAETSKIGKVILNKKQLDAIEELGLTPKNNFRGYRRAFNLKKLQNFGISYPDMYVQVTYDNELTVNLGSSLPVHIGNRRVSAIILDLDLLSPIEELAELVAAKHDMCTCGHTRAMHRSDRCFRLGCTCTCFKLVAG